MAMVSLGVYSWNSGRIIGPLLGTALVLLVGPAWTIGFNAASFVVLAVAVTMVRRSFRPTRSDGTILDRLAGGWRTLRSTTGCFHGVALLVLYNLTIVPFIGLIPIYLRAEYGGGTGMAGAVASAQGVGAIVGGVIVAMLAHRHPRSLLIGRLIVMLALSLGLYAVAPNAIWVVAASALLGGSGAGFFIASSAIIQRDAPAASRGRVMSIMQAAMGVSYGVGLLFIGSSATPPTCTSLHHRRGAAPHRFRPADAALAPLAHSRRRGTPSCRRDGLTAQPVAPTDAATAPAAAADVASEINRRTILPTDSSDVPARALSMRSRACRRDERFGATTSNR